MRGVSFLRVVGRLKPGVTIEQARAAMPALQQGYREKRPDNADNSWSPVVIPAAEDATGDLRPAFLTLLAAVSFVLLIACSNVANLLLVRFTGRRREIALRMALGSSRGGVVRLFVFESMLVSLLAAVVGTCLALWVVSVIPKLAADNLPLEAGISLNAPVLLFTLGLSLLTGVAMGLYPAWQSSRADLVDGLKDGGRADQRQLAGNNASAAALVATQVGLSVVLLAGAALLITSFMRLSRQPSGFSPIGSGLAESACRRRRIRTRNRAHASWSAFTADSKNTPGRRGGRDKRWRAAGRQQLQLALCASRWQLRPRLISVRSVRTTVFRPVS